MASRSHASHSISENSSILSILPEVQPLPLAPPNEYAPEEVAVWVDMLHDGMPMRQCT
eukprot:CAMPEP_0195120164 /NCGR_PEP_ID=MMETSP0448-20130528/121213_1 /TAXON_ID=66468 /ORGANISM="Heterocapsa triquestra, Strain CCMP 448" /LENGTH=57 /DNA_ID=CAMNT_0040157561 /DNA_START=30 /DNA_END=199 /DNA_ORIENTATION=+